MGKMLERIESEQDNSNQTELNSAPADNFETSAGDFKDNEILQVDGIVDGSTQETFPKELIRKRLLAVKQLYKKKENQE